eukprot:sb/3474125/
MFSTPFYKFDVTLIVCHYCTGDYYIAGIFNLGSLVDVTGEDNVTTTICQHTGDGYAGNTDGYWEYQRMVAFALYLEQNTALPGGLTLGYKVYSLCSDIPLARQIGSLVSSDDTVLGVLGPGKKIFVEAAAGNPTSVHLPTFT